MRLLLVFAFALCFAGTAKADLIQTFATTNSGTGVISGQTFILELPGLVADGVTFNATLRATASDTLGLAAAGIGLISNGETLSFSMEITNEVGGTVAFNGFTENDYNNFSKIGFLSLDASSATTADNFFATTDGGDAVDISGTSPTSYSAIAGPGNPDSFRIEGVTGSFTGTAVPEPSSILILGFGMAILANRRRSIVRC